MQLYPASPHSAVRDPQSALVVLAHGAGAGERHPFMVTIARGLAERGADVVTFDFPYMREKRRVPDKAPVLEADFRNAIAEARARIGAARRLFIGGKSMGGRMATHLAAEGFDELRGVVALGYPLHPPGKPEQRRTAHLPSIQVPVLIVQGERDAFGTPEELKPVIQAMTAPVTLYVVPQGDHSLVVPKVAGIPQTEVYRTVLDTVSNWIRSIATFVAVCLMCTAPAMAQERTLAFVGGGTFGSVEAAPLAAVEVGFEVGHAFQIVGQVGGIQSVTSHEYQNEVDAATRAALAGTGFDARIDADIPVFYGLAAARFRAGRIGRMHPYVEAGAGFARLRVEFTSLTPGSFTVPADETGEETATDLLVVAGTGVMVPVVRAVAVDVGYRYGRIATEAFPLDVSSIIVGVRMRF